MVSRGKRVGSNMIHTVLFIVNNLWFVAFIVMVIGGIIGAIIK